MVDELQDFYKRSCRARLLSDPAVLGRLNNATAFMLTFPADVPAWLLADFTSFPSWAPLALRHPGCPAQTLEQWAGRRPYDVASNAAVPESMLRTIYRRGGFAIESAALRNPLLADVPCPDRSSLLPAWLANPARTQDELEASAHVSTLQSAIAETPHGPSLLQDLKQLDEDTKCGLARNPVTSPSVVTGIADGGSLRLRLAAAANPQHPCVSARETSHLVNAVRLLSAGGQVKAGEHLNESAVDALDILRQFGPHAPSTFSEGLEILHALVGKQSPREDSQTLIRLLACIVFEEMRGCGTPTIAETIQLQKLGKDLPYLADRDWEFTQVRTSKKAAAFESEPESKPKAPKIKIRPRSTSS